MKIIITIVILLVLFNSISIAEMLFTSQSLGLGKFGLKASLINSFEQKSDLGNTAEFSGSIGYGINPNFDIYGILSLTNYTNPEPAESIGGPGLGMLLKYRFLDYLAGIAAINRKDIKFKYGSFTFNSLYEDWEAGFILSRQFNNFIPYLGASYHYLTSKGKTEPVYASKANDLEIDLGFAIKSFKNQLLYFEFAFHNFNEQSGYSTHFVDLSLSISTRL